MNRPVSPRPKFEQIKLDLEKRILSGEYRHGDCLPSEENLAAFFAVGRNTVRKAVAQLLASGLVSKHQGQVSRIHYPPIRENRAEPRRAAAIRLAWFTNYTARDVNSNPVYFTMFNQMVEAAAARGLQVDFLSTDSPSCWTLFEENRHAYAGCFVANVTSVNTSRGMYERLASLENLIAIDEVPDTPARHLVSIDNYAGGRLAAQHLLQCGYRSPALLVAPFGHLAFSERRRGFEDAIAEFNAGGGKVQCQFQAVSMMDLNRDVERFCDRLPDIDSVFCYCDECAMALLVALRYHGLGVPGDLGVIGFDGLAVAQHLSPQLTTIAQPTAEVVQQALAMALQLPTAPPFRPIRLPGKLLPGETTRIITHKKRIFDHE